MNKFKSTKKLPKSVTPEEFVKIMKVVKKKHHKLAFAFAYMSGMRISEVINLQLDDVDFTSRQILIRSGKGDKDRVVPAPKNLPRSYYSALPYNLTPRALQLAFKGALKRAKITREGLSFHSLRHGFATHALQSGMPINQVQLLLGHSNVSVTSIYIQANPVDAIKKYEEIF